MERKNLLKYALIGIVVCVLVSAATLYYLKENDRNIKGIAGNVVLGCELPTEQPVLPILKVKEERVSNETEARALALKYFPEFENAPFIESGLDAFVLKNEHTIFNEYLEIYESGCLIYTRVNDYVIERVNISEFPEEEALTIAEHFISQHGGLGDFRLDFVSPIATYENETLVGVEGYFIVYEHLYNGTPLSGGDGIQLDVTSDRNVFSFYRLVRTPIEELDTVQMISASQAFEVLTAAPVSGDVTITIVDVCYYTNLYYTPQEHMNPTWRFKMEGGNYLYVDGVTGECL